MPKKATISFKSTGNPILTPNSTPIEIGTIEKLYVNLLGSSNSKYRDKLPDIVKITTRVHSIQNGP